MKQTKRWFNLLLAALMLVTSFTGFGISALAGGDEGEYYDDAGKWVKSGGSWSYYNYSGDKVKNDSYFIDGKVYVFDKNGKQITKKGWCTLVHSTIGWDDEEPIKEKTVYYINADGTAKTGWLKSGGSWYYFDEYSGQMATGSCLIDETAYVFEANGKLHTKAGWFTVKDALGRESSYYTAKSGIPYTGWQKINKKWYYFYSYGELDEYYSEQKVYVYDDNYQVVHKAGWHKIVIDSSDENSEYYWSYTDSKGLCKIGWQKIGGKQYFFEGGTGYRVSGIKQINSKLYYFNAKGVQHTKKGWLKVDGSWYYVGSNGVLLTGWQKLGGKWYFFDKRYGNMVEDSSYRIGNKTYVFDKNGVLLSKKGWYSVTYKDEDWSETVWYYLKDGGVAATGWQTIGGKQYYFNQYYGNMYSNISVRMDGKVYVFAESGALVTGKTGWYSVKRSADDERYTVWYYLNKDGTAKTGWQKIGKSWYYFFGENGRMANNEVARIAGKNYYFNKNGVWQKRKGWQKITGNTYYFGSDGLAVSGNKKISGKWYYFNPDGMLETDED